MSISMQPNKQSMEAMKRRLAEARGRLANNLPAMKQVAVFLDQWVQRNFMGAGDKVGGWEPYLYGGRLTTKAKGNAKSIEGRRWINTSAKLMMDTGTLRHSFLPFVRLGDAGIGSDLPYSKPHNDGIGVPQRRLLPRKSEVDRDVRQILESFVLLRVRKAND